MGLTKKLIFGAIALGILGLVGKGWYDSDIRASDSLARFYSKYSLKPAKEALQQGDKKRAKEIAKRGYNRLNYDVSRKVTEISFRSKYLEAVQDSLATIAF